MTTNNDVWAACMSIGLHEVDAINLHLVVSGARKAAILDGMCNVPEQKRAMAMQRVQALAEAYGVAMWHEVGTVSWEEPFVYSDTAENRRDVETLRTAKYHEESDASFHALARMLGMPQMGVGVMTEAMHNVASLCVVLHHDAEEATEKRELGLMAFRFVGLDDVDWRGIIRPFQSLLVGRALKQDEKEWVVHRVNWNLRVAQ